MSSRTVTALLARGLDSGLSDKLASQGYTLSALRRLTLRDLAGLGLSKDQAKVFLDKSRPPISAHVLYELQHECRRTCCVCRKQGRAIVIHHFVSWAESRSHRRDNLVVLCLLCHSEAHTHHEMARNLTPEQLRDHKVRWLETVRSRDVEVLLTPRHLGLAGAMWDYFNRLRLLNLAHDFQVELSEIPGYWTLRAAGTVGDRNCDPCAAEYQTIVPNRPFIYESINYQSSVDMYRFFEHLLYKLIRLMKVTDVTKAWSRTGLTSLATPGTMVAYTGAYRFKRKHAANKVGPGQVRDGYARRRRLEIRFVIDGWEATSTSAHDSHLSGIWVGTGIVLVRSIARHNHVLSFDTTCLALGTGFSDHQGTTPNIALLQTGDDFDCDEE